MPARKKESRSRSGRFKQTSNTALQIIKVESSSVSISARVINAGDNSFIVTVTGASTVTTTLEKGCSLDITAPSPSIVSVQGNTPPILGVYDLLQPGTAVRSGRFGWDALPAAAVIVIKKPGLYRIFNSGDNPLTINVGGMVASPVVQRNCSIDVFVTSELSISAAAEIQGVYDLLLPNSDVRSGRFKFGAGGAGAGEKLIIDLRDVPDDQLRRYRISNAGERTFRVKVPDGVGGTDKFFDLERDQSFDFQASNTINKQIFVLRLAGTGPISGVYDSLETL